MGGCNLTDRISAARALRGRRRAADSSKDKARRRPQIARLWQLQMLVRPQPHKAGRVSVIHRARSQRRTHSHVASVRAFPISISESGRCTPGRIAAFSASTLPWVMAAAKAAESIVMVR